MYRPNIMHLLTVALLAVTLVACGDKGKSDGAKDSTAGSSTGADTTSSSTEASGGNPGEMVKSEAGGFTAQLPEGFPQANESTTKVPTAVGNLDMVTYMATNTNAACMIAYADYPSKAFAKTDLEVMLDSTRSGAMQKINGEVTKEEKITLNGHPGRSVYFSGSSSGQTLHGRFDYYIVKPRLYQVGYMSAEKGDLESPSVAAFFKSFALSDTAAAQ
jgi:hypothetical protein